MATRFVHHVGLQFEQPEGGRSRITLPIEPHHFNSTGVVHGGVLFTLADTGMGAALYSKLERGLFSATVEIKISYFKPVTAGTLACETEIVNLGRRLATLESSLLVGDVLVARASGTFAILERKA